MDPKLIEKNYNAVPASENPTCQPDVGVDPKLIEVNDNAVPDASENPSYELDVGVDPKLIEVNDNAVPASPLKEEPAIGTESLDEGRNPSQENDSNSLHYFDVDIPRIGTSFFPDFDAKPFIGRYDLAKQANEARGLQSQKETDGFPAVGFHEMMRIKNSRTDAEKRADKAKKRARDQKTAIRLTRLSIRILKILESEELEEQQLDACFEHFLDMPVSPDSLLYAPHFVHTIMFCRGQRDLLSHRLRSKANDCFHKCHCMFGVPIGLNFESVYTAQVLRLPLPTGYDKLVEEIPLEYEDLSSEDESEVSETSMPPSPRNYLDEESSDSVPSR